MFPSHRGQVGNIFLYVEYEAVSYLTAHGLVTPDLENHAVIGNYRGPEAVVLGQTRDRFVDLLALGAE